MNRTLLVPVLLFAFVPAGLLAACFGDVDLPDVRSDAGPSHGDSGAPIDAAGSDSGSDAGIDAWVDAGTADAGDAAPPPDAGSDASGADAGPAPPPSCVPGGAGMTDCGGGESCCTSLAVHGGTYDRTYTNDGTGATAEADTATISSFRLDKYEVTVGRFRQFAAVWGTTWTPTAGAGKHVYLNAGQGVVNVGSATASYESGWSVSDNSNVAPTNANLGGAGGTWTAAPGANERLPITFANWWEAYAFCIWDGGFLPTEAEWEYAAAGGTLQLEYPWGSATPGVGNQYAIYECAYPSGTANNCASSALTNIAPVGTAASGAGTWGQLDLAGNVWEWTLDYLDPYKTCTDCANLTVGASGTTASYHVMRGGSFGVPAQAIVPWDRGDDPPTTRNPTIGFRCARTP